MGKDTYSRLPRLATEKLTVSYTVEIPVSTLRMFIHTNHSAYWAKALVEDSHSEAVVPDGSAWLLFDYVQGDREDKPLAVVTARANLALPPAARAPLPAGYYLIDLDVARRAYLAGCRRWGEGWENRERGDATGYDIALQLALFGEVKYG